MFVGHYAAAIGISAYSQEKGALTFIALSSALPDILMLSMGMAGGSLNFHADLGLLICLGFVLGLGIITKLSWKIIGLALLALGLHLPLDLPYIATDSRNLYAHPEIDFVLEVTLLLAAAWFYLKKQHLQKQRRYWFLSMIFGIVLLQGGWNLFYRF